MLYLIRTFGRRGRSALKVGFANDLDKRLKTYYYHNPYFEIVATRDGELYEEMVMHLYLQSKGYKESILNEWFLDCNDVLTEFHAKKNKMLKSIWKNRNSLFSLSDFKSTKDNSSVIKKRIYEDLRLIYYDEKKAVEIDITWKLEASRKVYRKTKSLYID